MDSTRRTFCLAGAAFAVASPARGDAGAEPYPYARVGTAAATFRLPKFGGGVARLSDYHNKTLVLAFGGLWCGDCIVEEQELNQLAHLIEQQQSMRFLALQCYDRYGRWGESGPTAEAATAAVTAYRQDMSTQYPLAFDLDGAVTQAYGVEWFPTILIIDRRGVVRSNTTDLRRHTVARFFAEAEAIAGA